MGVWRELWGESGCWWVSWVSDFRVRGRVCGLGIG